MSNVFKFVKNTTCTIVIIHKTQFLINAPCSSTVHQRQELLAARMDLSQFEAGCPCILARPGEHPESAASLARWGTC